MEIYGNGDAGRQELAECLGRSKQDGALSFFIREGL